MAEILSSAVSTCHLPILCQLHAAVVVPIFWGLIHFGKPFKNRLVPSKNILGVVRLVEEPSFSDVVLQPTRGSASVEDLVVIVVSINNCGLVLLKSVD